MDLPWDVDHLKVAACEKEWQAYLKASRITDEAETLLLIEWLRARSAPNGRAGSRQGITKVALTSLGRTTATRYLPSGGGGSRARADGLGSR